MGHLPRDIREDLDYHEGGGMEVIQEAAAEESVPMKISDEAVTAAIDALPYQAADYVDTDTMRAALEAAAPHMLAYRWPLGDDDNPHRDGDVQPRRHWLVNSDTGWECSGCDWTGAILKDYWTEHEKLDEYQVPF